MTGQGAQEATPKLPKLSLKDPFQTEPTPYEVLGVDRDAGAADIQKAFAQGLAARINVQKLTSAKRILQSPAERAVIDLFQYVPAWAERLSPNPLMETQALVPARRAATARSWEKQLSAGFPDPGIAHSLAVLWYWWAISEGKQPEGARQSNGSMSVEEMWRKAIAAWAMVLAHDNVWPDALGITSDVATQVSGSVIARLNSYFQEAAQTERSKNSRLAARYQELELAFATELRTAKLIGAAGIRTSRGKIVCGILMLEQTGLLESVRTQVEELSKRSSSSENLKRLKIALSPYASILTLLENNKPQDALEALNRLPEATQKASEGRSTRIRALHGLAEQKVGIGNVEEALGLWEKALQLQPDPEMRSSISAALVAGCQSRVASIQNHDPETAITLLDLALSLVSDGRLKLLAGELLTTRGIKKINDAQASVQSKDQVNVDRAKRDIEAGLQDLQRAADLGVRRATDQLKEARKLYANFCGYLNSGAVYLTSKQAELVGKARAAANLGNFDEAIEILRSALSGADRRSAGIIKKELAELLTVRAIQRVNNTVAAIEAHAKASSAGSSKDVSLYLRMNGTFKLLFLLVGFICAQGSSDAGFAIARLIARFWYVPLIIGAGVFGVATGNDLSEQITKGSLALVAAIAFLIVWAVVRALVRKVVAGGHATMLMGRGYRVYESSSLICQLCLHETKYQISVPGKGSLRVCEAHANGLQELLGRGSGPKTMMEYAQNQAAKDLLDALENDPANTHAKDALEKIKKMQNREDDRDF